MLQKRLILCLMMRGDYFVNSRNFVLNPVGNLETILTYLHFETIDELVLLNVARGEKNLIGFTQSLRQLARRCFIPITAGGGVKRMSDCEMLLSAGADKIAINSAAFDNPNFVRCAVKEYGGQCIVRSIDVKWSTSRADWLTYVDNGARQTGETVLAAAKKSESLGMGEIFLTSIDRDGTCEGYDLDLLSKVINAVSVPVIASGGVGEFSHLVQGIEVGASAVSAGNLFHFLGNSMHKVKDFVRASGLSFPQPLWHFQSDHKL